MDTAVLILTARTLTEDRTRGFDAGANQYLTKPFDLDEFLSRVKNLLTYHGRDKRRAVQRQSRRRSSSPTPRSTSRPSR